MTKVLLTSGAAEVDTMNKFYANKFENTDKIYKF